MKNIEQRTGSFSFLKLFKECRLCPRACGIDRTGITEEGRSGFCGQDYNLRVAYIGPHFGEEPPLTGMNGSGTVFFSGCSLKCSFCQNYQISKDGVGRILNIDELYTEIFGLIRDKEVHNINFVTPDHFFPYTFQLISLIRERGLRLPAIYNLSGYQSMEMLGLAEDYADIYLPDYKYSDTGASLKFSGCKDYPEVALTAIGEMVRQKGFLDSFFNGADIASKGVLVRHLILPGRIQNSLNALTSLFLEFGRDIPISLMSQYRPVLSHEDNDFNRPVRKEEFDKVYEHATNLGFNNLFVQFPDAASIEPADRIDFLPDFSRAKPFRGNSPC